MRSRCVKKDISPLVKLWILRLLVPMGFHKHLLSKRSVEDDFIAEAIGLGNWVNSDEYTRELAFNDLKQIYEKTEKVSKRITLHNELERNIEMMSTVIGLSDIDKQVLRFSVLLDNNILNRCTEMIDSGAMSLLTVCSILGEILKIPEKEVQMALSQKGILVRSGLLPDVNVRCLKFASRFSFMSDDFADNLMMKVSEPSDLIKNIVCLSQPPKLTLDEFDHIKDQLSLMIPYLGQACAENRKGVNILLYGPPGTGKTQLAKTITKNLGYDLYEIACDDAIGCAIDGSRRMAAFRAAQCLLSKKKALILFDEVEDIFADDGGVRGKKSTAQNSKAWMNKLLEENPIPSFWISNEIRCVDSAYIRRFDMVIDLSSPPKKQIIKMMTDNCSDSLSKQHIANIAEIKEITPAIIERAISVINVIRHNSSNEVDNEAIETLINNTLKAQGFSSIKKINVSVPLEFYDPSFINSSMNLGELAEGFIRSKSGRICIYGPPGTGKTAFARWLATQLDVPLHVNKASDLLSMFLGETEKNISNAFRLAEKEGALLLLDEVDSFLQDRRGAQRSWEVTQVNEMLTQMESFSGVFVASTNLMEGLDQASLRRFDLKLNFGYLKPMQACRVFRQYCDLLVIHGLSDLELHRITKMTLLTLGDFAAVARQHRFKPIRNASGLIDALEMECVVKEGGQKNKIGFVLT